MAINKRFSIKELDCEHPLIGSKSVYFIVLDNKHPLGYPQTKDAAMTILKWLKSTDETALEEDVSEDMKNNNSWEL